MSKLHMEVVGIVVISAVLWLGGGCGPSPGSTDDAGQNHDALNSHLREDGSQSDAQQDVAPWDAPPPTPKIVYAHTTTTLYQGDPSVSPLTLVEVGDFDCIGGSGQDTSMTDVAVDRDGNVYAVSATSFYPLTISGNTVHCGTRHLLPTAASFYGLSFAPAGVLGPTETLVAANSAGQLYYIDDQGQTTLVGNFGKVPPHDGRNHTYDSGNVGKDWELSGDIVFLENGGDWVGFATLCDCPTPPDKDNCNKVDTLVEIDLTKLAPNFTGSVVKSLKGQVVKSATCSDPGNQNGYGSTYGIVAWEGKVFGFSNGGNLIEISNGDGSACLVQNYPDYRFMGAGITTTAPVILE
jgi:hypothetical protein